MNDLRLFPQLRDKKLLADIAEYGRETSFPTQTVIMDYGQYLSHMPLLLDGSIKIMREDEDGHEILLYHVYPGSTCAVSLTCCMERRRSEIRAIAETDVSMIMLPVEQMEPWMRQYSGWRQFVIKTYADRFAELLRVIDDTAFRKLDERLVRYLLRRTQAAGTRTLQTTHQEIAQDLNGSRESISRLLKQLERMGKIRLSRNVVEVLDL